MLITPVGAADKTLKITVIVEHPALDAARKGNKDELAERGYEAGKRSATNTFIREIEPRTKH